MNNYSENSVKNEENISNLYWCAGFFDGEGSFSLSGNAQVVLVNTNPIAISNFLGIMAKNGLSFGVSERAKSSKSSKKKRWDLYLKESEILKFISLVENKIQGKNKQLYLMKEYLLENKKKENERYNKLMKYTNQTCHMLVKDDNVLWDKLGFIPDSITHKNINETEEIIEFDSFNNIYYLAGILDAEGCVHMDHRFNKHRNGTDRYTPFIFITNTNKMIINKCCSVLKNNNIGHHIQFRTSNHRNRGRWDILVSGIKRVLNLSILLDGKLIVKKQQMELMKKYCELRLLDIKSKNDIGLSYKEAIEALNKSN